MATTESNITVTNATERTYGFTFPYLKTTDVKLSINGVAKTFGTGSGQWQFANATNIQLNNNPTVGDKLRIYRETDDSKLEANFFAGSAIKSSDLNDNFTQNLYVTQESNNKIDAAWTSGDETIDTTETWASNNTRIATTGAIDGRVDSKVNTAITTKVVGGDRVTATASGGDTVTLKVTPASLVNSDVNASAAIAGTKISPDFGSQNIATTGTVDGRDVSVDGAKLDGIETGATADQTAAEIRTLVEAASDSHVFTTADHTKLDGIETAATGDQTNAEIRTAVEAATDSNVFTDADHTKLNAIEAGATADQTVGEIKTLIAGSPLDASHLAANAVGDSEIATGALDNRYYTETELNAGQLDNRYYTETESDARYFNVSTGDTIKDGDAFPDNDTTIATTAAINDRIIDLVDDVGGFVPIANETSFPNANPDVNNGTGTLISIKALSSNLTSNGSGVATIANGTVGNSTVTITGLANSTTYSSAYGMIVETTTTLNTYTFHRQVPIATEVNTVASNISNVNAVGNNTTNINTVAGNTTNINTVAGANSNITSVAGSISNVNTVATNISNVNDFSDKYRVASSAPTSSLDTGDLYFDTSANELKVYNGSAWQGGVTATGNLAGLGANTFTGNQSLGDTNKVQLGASNDLQIYHDGSHSYFTNSTGNTYLRGDGSSWMFIQAKSGEHSIIAKPNGSVELYYDDSKKFETTSSGATVTGQLAIGTVARIESTGEVKATHGSASTPAYNFLNDNDNGMYRITTNTIGFSTGGTEALRLDGSQNALFAGDIDLADSKKIKLGNSDDLQIYHDGGSSFIKHDGQGHLYVYAAGTSEDLYLRAADNVHIETQTSDTAINAIGNGAVELYYDNSKKFETITSGVRISGDLELLDNTGSTGRLLLGNGADLRLYHTGTESWIRDVGTGNLYLDTNGSRISLISDGSESNGSMAKFIKDGAVELYYDGSKKFETVSTGCEVFGSLGIARTAGGYTFREVAGGNERAGIHSNSSNEIVIKTAGAAEVARFTSSNLRMNDNKKIELGSSQDLQIYHDGTNSIIKETGTGILYVGGNQVQLYSSTNGETMLRAFENGAVELYYDNSKKLETTSTGATVTGDLTVNTSTDASVFVNTTNANGAHIRLQNSGTTKTYFGQASGISGSLGNANDFAIRSAEDIVFSTNNNNTPNVKIDTSGNLDVSAGTVSDSKGDLRKIIRIQKSSAHTLVADDAGKGVGISSGGVTVPQNVFASGDAVTIINQSGSDQTITQGSGVTMYNAADASTGNRTLAGRGMATIWFNNGTSCYISGAGLS